MIKTICYGKVDYFKTAKDAISYFSRGMCFCDPGSSEYERYSTIVNKLESGKTTASDDYWGNDD